MKPKKIQRDIQSRNSRPVGDAPLLGRVGRMRDEEAPGIRRRMRRDGRHYPPREMVKRNSMLLWSVVLAATALLVIGGFFFFWLRGHRSAGAAVPADAPLENVRIASKFASPEEDEALLIVKRALAVERKEDVLDLYHPGDSKPGEILGFVRKLRADGGEITRYEWLSSMDVDGLLMEGVVVYAERKGKTSEWLAFLTPDERGVWKVDFDALARSSSPSWVDIIEGKSERSIVRVFVGKDSYYNGPFQDEAVWNCYAMFSPETRELLPDDHELLRGYCRIGSAQEKAMSSIFTGGEQARRVILEIRKMDGADKRQFEISRVLAEDWVMPPKPFDERID
jgi:hypothetical protein